MWTKINIPSSYFTVVMLNRMEKTSKLKKLLVWNTIKWLNDLRKKEPIHWALGLNLPTHMDVILSIRQCHQFCDIHVENLILQHSVENQPMRGMLWDLNLNKCCIITSTMDKGREHCGRMQTSQTNPQRNFKFETMIYKTTHLCRIPRHDTECLIWLVMASGHISDKPALTLGTTSWYSPKILIYRAQFI